MSRPAWDQTWLQVAHVVSLRSRCSRAQCGAVIVSLSNRILATAYNGPPARLITGALPCTSWCDRGLLGPTSETIASYVDCPSIHAEMNAITFVDRSACEGGTIYITGPPCFSCGKVIANSGLRRVVYRDEPGREYRDVASTQKLLEASGISVTAA